MTKYLEIDTKKVSAKLDVLVDSFEGAGKLMSEIGNFLTFSILARTAEGRDVHGTAFEPYSTPYKKVREDKGLPTSRVDLFFTGQMTSSLTFDATRDAVQVFFMDTPRRGGKATNAAVAYYNNEVREFFAISSEEQKEILDLANEYFKRVLES